jgi:hypothetical protein
MIVGLSEIKVKRMCHSSKRWGSYLLVGCG